jgi:hypothetical protein
MSALYPSPPGYPVSYQWDLLLAGPCRRMSAGSWLTWALIAAQLEIWPTFFRWTGHRCCFSCRFCLWLDSGPFYGLSFGSAFTDANVSGRVPVFFLRSGCITILAASKLTAFPTEKRRFGYIYIWYIYDISLGIDPVLVKSSKSSLEMHRLPAVGSLWRRPQRTVGGRMGSQRIEARKEGAVLLPMWLLD